MKIFLLPAIIFLMFFASGCTSIMERTGRLLDGSAFAERTLSTYHNSTMQLSLAENKAGENFVIITLNDFPMMKLRGSMPGENGEFFLTALEYLAGNVQGWNEYTLELSGAGNLVLGENAVLSLNGEIEPVQISAGRIQRYDTRITGSDALTALRNRQERIAAITEWMASIENAPKRQSINEFEKHWQPFIFPETVSRNIRPYGWLQEGDVFTRADDIQWNTSYTERIFSEELQPVRNSGTLLRDWEEALSWIYLEYEWENIIQKLSGEIILQKR
jgi:hypothetical protein